MREMVSKNDRALFLLNRFHLSTYAWMIIQERKLGKQYQGIVDVLRMLPVHVFILHVDEKEIEKRSLHPERSGVWQKFQQQLVQNYGFRDRLEIQQKLILQAAMGQGIPYTIIKLASITPSSSEFQFENGEPDSFTKYQITPDTLVTSARPTGTSRKKRSLAQSLREHT